MLLKYITLRDPSLTHQVVLFTQSMSSDVMISCNCRGRGVEGGKIAYDPIAATDNLEQSRQLYNNPKNHTLPFDETDKARW